MPSRPAVRVGDAPIHEVRDGPAGGTGPGEGFEAAAVAGTPAPVDAIGAPHLMQNLSLSPTDAPQFGQYTLPSPRGGIRPTFIKFSVADSGSVDA